MALPNAVAPKCEYEDEDMDSLILGLSEEQMMGKEPPPPPSLPSPPPPLPRPPPSPSPMSPMGSPTAPRPDLKRNMDTMTSTAPQRAGGFGAKSSAAGGGAKFTEDIDALQEEKLRPVLDEWQTAVVEAALDENSFFLTGMAGTGKSKVLEEIIRQLRAQGKTVFVTAPTGVAASNINGTTIHSFAGLSGQSKPPFHCMKPDARDRIRDTDVFVIDEISMVSNHFMDGLNVLFREVREKPHLEFGGAQVIVCGDFGQIPPVDDKGKQDAIRNNGRMHPVQDAYSNKAVRLDEHEGEVSKAWEKIYEELLTPTADPISPCFLSRCWKRMFAKSFFQLHKIYRQDSDKVFVGMLQEIRDGRPSANTVAALNERHIIRHPEHYKKRADGSMALADNFTCLFSHRKDADDYNTNKLKAIRNDRGYNYEAEDYAIRPQLLAIIPGISPLAQMLQLKVGTRVMLKKNIAGGENALVNGSVGTLIGFAQVMAIEGGTMLARPVEGAVMPHVVRNLDASVDPYTVDYTPPRDPLASVGTTMDEVKLRPGAHMSNFCPRPVFNRLCELDQKRGTQTPTFFTPRGPPAPVVTSMLIPGDTMSAVVHWSLLAADKRQAQRDNRFYPLPVVQFDNGEVVVITPHMWSIEERGKGTPNPANEKQQPVMSKRGPVAVQYKFQKRVVVSRWQLPLIMAWAISIHASQGLTLARLCVDVSKIFNPGMGYVALSRATSLDGLLLWHPLNVKLLQQVDPRVAGFYRYLCAMEAKGVGRPKPITFKQAEEVPETDGATPGPDPSKKEEKDEEEEAEEVEES